ncbi:MAG: universal stress protein [Candidatus Binatia bacterium]
MKILLAIDGSACSEAAVKEIAARRWPDHSHIKILAAVTAPYPDIPDPTLTFYPIRMEMLNKERDRLRELVEHKASWLRENSVDKDVTIDTAIVDGAPKSVIVEEAEQWGADLIVLGCHGYGPVKRFLLGSVSQAVATHAPCSVEIVRSRHEE